MRFIFLLVTATSALLAQPAFSHREETAIWIDFDGTIATNEAFETLALAAYESKTPEEAALYPPWSYYGDIYNRDYLAFSTAFGPRNNITAELAYRSSPALRKVESDSFDRVDAAGVFKHIDLPVLRRAAAAVTIRDGFWKFIAAAHEHGITPRIASLNWSVRWIRLVLREDLKKKRRAAASREDRKWMKEELAETIAIYCAEILPEGVVERNRLDFPTRLHTGADKVQLMKRHVKGGSDWRRRVLFFGDSTNDLPPLMQSPTTVGVVAGRDAGMNKTLMAFGIDLVGLDPDMNLKSVQDTTGRGFLYQIDEFVLTPGMIFPHGKGGR